MISRLLIVFLYSLCMKARATAAMLLFCGAFERPLAATYYVSATGNDAGSGLSPAEAWRTIVRANAADFEPGDRLLFEGGKTFHGTLELDLSDSGTAINPVQIGSYRRREAGRAVIHAAGGCAIHVANTSGLHIRDLNLTGNGDRRNRSSGLLIYTTLPDGASHLRIEGTNISGFGMHGLSLGAWRTNAGYRNIIITQCRFHDNFRTGIMTWGPWGEGIYAHKNLYVGHCRAYRMDGGSGITLSSVDGGTVEHSVAHHNGREFSGGAGIWAWDSNEILFQYNESHHNRTIGVDGDGFDFDGGVTNSIMQYNFSHDNDAAGFLVAQYQYAPQPMRNIVIRYNISENDCRKKGYGALHVWNGDTPDRMGGILIHNNTVVLDRPKGAMPCAISLVSGTGEVVVANNLFITRGNVPLVSVTIHQEAVSFRGNAYWTSGDRFSVDWKGTRHQSMESWLAAANGQEHPGGLFLDPLLAGAYPVGTIERRDFTQALAPYRLSAESPLRLAGIDLEADYGAGSIERCLFGDPASRTIGAATMGTGAPD